MNDTATGASALDAIKQRQQAMWASGDFAVIGVTLQIVGESLAEAADIRAGERVLDVAAGNGNASLAAARRFARVTSTDYVPALLEKGRARAAAEGLQLSFLVADAEHLPCADQSFDVVLSSFGAMFAPDHARAAAEMVRVLRPGGRIALANWTPEGGVGQLMQLLGRHVPPPVELRSPLLWGTETHLRELFGGLEMQGERKTFKFRYASAAHWLQIFRDYFGPLHQAFAALAPGPAHALELDILTLLERCNTGGANSLVMPAEYLEVVLRKPGAAPN